MYRRQNKSKLLKKGENSIHNLALKDELAQTLQTEWTPSKQESKGARVGVLLFLPLIKSYKYSGAVLITVLMCQTYF